MATKDCVYTNTDKEYQEICDFLDTLATKDPCMLWESGRTNFWRHTVHAEKDPEGSWFRENVHVWRGADDQMVALFISEYGEDDFFIEVMPAYRHIYPDIFRWIYDNWATSRTTIEIDVFSDDAEKIRRLLGEGFELKVHSENLRAYDLDEVELAYELEDGFHVQAFSESMDFDSRVALVRSAFDNPGYTEARVRGMMASPDYVDAYNLVVVSPEGRHVAYCVGWHERADPQAGYIEPVGTHANFRRRGFATAVIRECFARMKANGVRTVEIASGAEPNISNFLYDSLGPKSKREVHKYAKAVS